MRRGSRLLSNEQISKVFKELGLQESQERQKFIILAGDSSFRFSCDEQQNVSKETEKGGIP